MRQDIRLEPDAVGANIVELIDPLFGLLIDRNGQYNETRLLTYGNSSNCGPRQTLVTREDVAQKYWMNCITGESLRYSPEAELFASTTVSIDRLATIARQLSEYIFPDEFLAEPVEHDELQLGSGDVHTNNEWLQKISFGQHPIARIHDRFDGHYLERQLKPWEYAITMTDLAGVGLDFRLLGPEEFAARHRDTGLKPFADVYEVRAAVAATRFINTIGNQVGSFKKNPIAQLDRATDTIRYLNALMGDDVADTHPALHNFLTMQDYLAVIRRGEGIEPDEQADLTEEFYAGLDRIRMALRTPLEPGVAEQAYETIRLQTAA